ncbi:hypothetical protein ABZX40_28040 [Streptomyces sp. NPDC004610]|uniref:hypothetical protein n=1 Tax=unclassified Streptomyces TaxID=2593676 RepID=UPI0033A21545
MDATPNTRITVSRVPSKPVRRRDDGRLAIDLCRDGAFDTDATLHLTPAEAETLHAQLCFVLDDDADTSVGPGTRRPECRKGVAADHRAL